eukprot:356027_1
MMRKVFDAAEMSNITDIVDFDKKNYADFDRHCMIRKHNKPANLRIVLDPFDNTLADCNDCLYCFTDGSIIADRAGGGLVAIHNDILVMEEAIGYGSSSDITFVELFGIRTIWQSIQQLIRTMAVSKIHIMTDSKPSLHWMNGKSKELYIHIVIHELFCLIGASRHNVTIQWCRRESNNGIKRADRLAKQGTQINNPDGFYDFHDLSRKSIKYMKEQLKRYKMGNIRDNMMKYHGKSHLYSRNIRRWNIRYWPILNELKHFSRFEVGMLLRLRIEHGIDLNLYQHIRCHQLEYKNQQKKNKQHLQLIVCKDQTCECTKYNGGRCDECDVWEDVEHFILKCPKYECDIRNHLRQYNLRELLFPNDMYNLHLVLEFIYQTQRKIMLR